ncbi:hypothetical protein BpHYR1_023161 [Brachionus plicatilis]|uniref:Uncharacterized protein n=1 Tax=Brachionus plicatilis TaxID=10195 RepID=A0A3M7P5L9_BRAPC|nr:hypothetical protein BpHYR1_023161 [Brachionus plicatilis]
MSKFKLQDANKFVDPRKYCTLRIHFFTHKIKRATISQLFQRFENDGLKIEDISEETYKDSTIKKVVKRVKTAFPKDADPIIQSLSRQIKNELPNKTLIVIYLINVSSTKI